MPGRRAQPAVTGPVRTSSLRGGAVYLVNAARSWAQAVAVGGDRIIAVGSDDEFAS